jgi:hypothetical protein
LQTAEIQYDKEKQRVQLKIPKLMDKRRTQLKSAPDYYVGNDLIDTTVYQELFHISEDSDEIYDSDDSYDSQYDSDCESTISEDDSDWEESEDSEESDDEFEIP